MRRILALGIVFLSAALATAQPRTPGIGIGIGVGPGYGYGSGFGGPGFGGYGYPYGGYGFGRGYPFYGPYYPGAYGSFWSNGYSLYGPPVPTYGSVPGFFGGSDQRMGRGAPLNPFFGPFPVGIYVPISGGSAGNSFASYGNPQALSEPRLLPIAPEIQPARATVKIEVHLATAEAILTVNGHRTVGDGTVRLLESPDVPSGQDFRYEVEAEWVAEGEPRKEIRILTVRSGESHVVDFVAR